MATLAQILTEARDGDERSAPYYTLEQLIPQLSDFPYDELSLPVIAQRESLDALRQFAAEHKFTIDDFTEENDAHLVLLLCGVNKEQLVLLKRFDDYSVCYQEPDLLVTA
jgi:hypothetical protein